MYEINNFQNNDKLINPAMEFHRRICVYNI